MVMCRRCDSWRRGARPGEQLLAQEQARVVPLMACDAGARELGRVPATAVCTEVFARA
eukprot:COSAG03_NODE_358_length_8602_cov_7.201694_5_plen_58_part_00